MTNQPFPFVGVLQALLTFAVGVAGAYLAHSFRRQLQVKTADARIVAYTALWEALKPAAPGREEPLSFSERLALHQAATDWYYDRGQGMMLASGTRQLYLTAKENLTCPLSRLAPVVARERLASILSNEVREDARGRLSMRQLSLLRTRMKADIAVYGRVYSRGLDAEDIAFLAECGESVRRQPWRASRIRGGHLTQKRGFMASDNASPSSFESTIIAAVFLVLIGAIAVVGIVTYDNVDDFLKFWGVIGTLVGVVTGAIPSYFFSRAARSARDDATKHLEASMRAEARARLLYAMADETTREKAAMAMPDVFPHGATI